MTPHPYQQEYLSGIRELWKQHQRILVVAPTGSGKTVMFSHLAKDEPGRVLILVDQDELVWQTVRKIESVCGITPDVEKAEHQASLGARVVVGSVQTLMREKRRANWPRDHFQLIIADEADKSIAPSWQSVLKHFDEKSKVCGFTATPHRTDQRNLGEYYEESIEKETLFSLIKKGYLAPLSVQMLPITLDLSIGGNGKDFTDNEADDIITPHLEQIAKSIKSYAHDRRSLVFLPLIKTCEKFSEIAQDLGLICDYVYGVDKDRDGKIQTFRDGFTDVLANSMLLTRGVDIPEVNCIVPCRPTKSVTLYFQMCGRGTRIAPGKTDCLLLDFLYQATKKMICRPAHLIAKSDDEVEQITKILEGNGMPEDVIAQLDLIDVAADATSQREEALRKRLEELRNKKAEFISAEAFAIGKNNLAAAEFEATMKWHSDPVTEKQKKYLEQAKIDIETVHGKGHANVLLSLHFKTKPLVLATQPQRFLLRRLGYPNWASATDREFFGFMAQRSKKEKATA